MNAVAVEIVKDSLTRCMGKDIIGHFYDIFLQSNPEIAPKFARTDFQAQRDLLKHGIQLAIMFAQDDPMGRKGLARIRESHSKANLDIAPSLYHFWKSSFLRAVSDLDPKFSEESRRAWDVVLQKAIDYITSGYDVSGGGRKRVVAESEQGRVRPKESAG
jgi:hemoglobin-like flavoprotein